MSVKYLFIEGTNEQYMVSSEGRFFRMYKRTNQGDINYDVNEVSPYIEKQPSGHLRPKITLYINNKAKGFWVVTLIEKTFNLCPPDNFHQYVLRHKDGNMLNNSLSNLVYRIVSSRRTFPFYPQPFYDKKGNITHKICSECGCKYTIDHFTLNYHKPTNKFTFRNACQPCRSKITWTKTKNDPVLLQRRKFYANKFLKSEKGKAWMKSYSKKYRETDKSQLTKGYVARMLRINVSDMPDELYEAKKQLIKLKNLVKI